jgi:exonuclease VII small subunit
MASIADIFSRSGDFSAAQSLVQLNTLAATPNFELRFNTAQNAALDRLNEKITEINSADFGRGKTALFKVKIARLEREKAALEPFKSTTLTNRYSVKAAIEQLAELRDLADPSSVSEFEAKLAQVQDTFATFRTAKRFNYGVPDKLGTARDDGNATLDAITHNNFASQADIDAAQSAIDTVSASLDESLVYIDLNFTIAKNLYKSADVGLDKAKLKVDDIESAERERKVAEIKELEEQTSRILTNISLSFEVAQGFTEAINKNAILPREVEPGSVLNLFA